MNFFPLSPLSMAVFNRCLRARASSPTAYLIQTLSASSCSSTLNTCGGNLKSASLLGKDSSLHLKSEPKGKNVQWMFLGCPGVGKGTYASRLSNLLGVPHIATGDLVRDELSSSGLLASQLKEIVNQGKLVSDEIIIDLLSKRLESEKGRGKSGFILDGFPQG